jgi:AcrR family transcriptional regulator
MVRPKPDEDERRALLIKSAETILRANRGRRLVMSDVAAEAGMSQSYSYRFFANKDALVAAMADVWFAKVTEAVKTLSTSADPVESRLESFVLVQMRIKCAQYDEDSELFQAYLNLAAEHPSVAMAHVRDMEAVLIDLMRERLGKGGFEAAATAFGDATRMFRDPYVIARMRPAITETRARFVVAILLSGLDRFQS